MNRLFTFLIVFGSIYHFSSAIAQTSKEDSLWAVWNNESNPDSARLKAIGTISWSTIFSNPDSGFVLAQIEYNFAKEKGLKKRMAKALTTLGSSFYMKSEFDTAVFYFKQSASIQNEIEDRIGLNATLNNIANVCLLQGDYTSAIDAYSKSLKYYEDEGMISEAGSVLGNIGRVHSFTNNSEKALDCFQRALELNKSVNRHTGIAGCLNSIGNIYFSKERYKDALQLSFEALTIYEEIEQKDGIANACIWIGKNYLELEKYSEAMDFLQRSLVINEELGSKRLASSSVLNIGKVHFAMRNYSKAKEFGSRSLNLAKEVDAQAEIQASALLLSKVYKATSKPALALEMYELYISTRDSLQSEENQKSVIRQGFKYEYEKQAAIDSLMHDEEQKLSAATIEKQEAEADKKDAEIEAQRNLQIALYGGLGLLCLFGGFMYNRFRVTRKQKVVIEQQKDEVEFQKEIIEETHKEITDSIQYAKRIQSAILPPPKLVKEYLADSFILYKPKDVVAGDFYWLEAQKDLVLFAAADCTGHGVPGAMVSVICNNGLNRSVREYGIVDPGKILDKTREIVISEFEKSEEEVKDGMDVALCALKGRTLKYAGAHNPLWIIRNGSSEVDEIKANKQPIGMFDKPLPYTTHELELNAGDSIYIFSDGFADQFGGEKGKKFKSANFKKLLLSIQMETLPRQKELINQAFEEWKGNLEQLDDVCVIGLKV